MKNLKLLLLIFSLFIVFPISAQDVPDVTRHKSGQRYTIGKKVRATDGNLYVVDSVTSATPPGPGWTQVPEAKLFEVKKSIAPTISDVLPFGAMFLDTVSNNKYMSLGNGSFRLTEKNNIPLAQRIVESVTELRLIDDAKIGEAIKTKSYYGDGNGGGATFVKVTNTGQSDNGGTIIQASNGDIWEAQLLNPNEIDIKLFGAVEGVQFSNKKVMNIAVNPVGVIPDATDAINNAIAWLDRDRIVFPSSAVTFNIPNKKLVINGHYLLDPSGLNTATDVAITVPNGISVHCVGQSSLHTTYEGINILLDQSYNTTHRINIYKKLWLTINQGDWYVKTGNTVPDDVNSAGVVLNSGRRNILYVEVFNFVKGIHLQDNAADKGTVDNVIYLGNILNCRYGVAIMPDAGGWANQNTFYGGTVKIMGYIDRHASINTTCSALEVQGQNNVFHNTNLEGNSEYQYSINDWWGNNLYLNPRLESSGFHNKVNFQSLGSIVQGGTHNVINALGTFSAYENISGSLDLTKKGYVNDYKNQSIDLNKGQLLLSGRGTTDLAPTSVLTLRSQVGKEKLLEVGKDRFRIYHTIHGSDDDQKVEFHTYNDDYVDLKALHQDTGIYNLITHSPGGTAGIGDWVDNTATDGNWYFASDLFVMGADMATDIASAKFQEEPRSLNPILFTQGRVMAPEFSGILDDESPTSSQNRYGTHDLHNLKSTTWSKVNLSANLSNFDPTGLTPTIFFNNTDTGVEHTVSFDKSETTKLRGGFYLFHNQQADAAWQLSDSAPIRFADNDITGIKSLNGKDIVLNAGEWVLTRIHRHKDTEMSFTEVTRSRIDQLVRTTSGNHASLPSSPVITEKYFHTDLGMEIQYDGTIWTKDGYRVIGTVAQQPTGVSRGFKYYNTDAPIGVVTNDGTDTWN